MSKTPMTDRLRELVDSGDCLPGCDSYAHEEMCPTGNAERVLLTEYEKLELELNAILEQRYNIVRRLNEYREEENRSTENLGKWIAYVDRLKTAVSGVIEAYENYKRYNSTNSRYMLNHAITSLKELMK